MFGEVAAYELAEYFLFVDEFAVRVAGGGAFDFVVAGGCGLGFEEGEG
mgnify:FL=1